MPDFNEKKLIAQAQKDPQAFAPLYEHFVDRIYGYIYRRIGDQALTQDITSATFENALRKIHKYRWQGTSFVTWLYRIARNQMIQQQRKHRVLSMVGINQSNHLHDSEESLLILEQNEILHAAFSRLSNQDQEVITLRFFEELSSQEVAEILNCSKQNLYLRLHRALMRMRKQLDALEEQEGEAYVSQ